jgi:hypothetical protein
MRVYDVNIHRSHTTWASDSPFTPGETLMMLKPILAGAAMLVTGADFRAGDKGRGKKGLVDVRHVA